MIEERKFSKEEIMTAFKEWETRFRNNPDDFTPTTQDDDLDEIAKLKADYLVGLIVELEK